MSQRLVACKYFTLDYFHRVGPFSLGDGFLQVVIALHGMGVLHTPVGPWELKAGDSLLLPASMERVELRPEGTLGLLLAGLPQP